MKKLMIYTLKILFNNDGIDYSKIIDKIKKYNLLVFVNDYNFVKNMINYKIFNLNSNYEKILIEASNNSNVYIMELLIKALLNNYITNNEKFSSNKYNPQYINLILNKAIENNNMNLFKYILESDEFKNSIEINIKDVKGEYLIIKTLYSKKNQNI